MNADNTYIYPSFKTATPAKSERLSWLSQAFNRRVSLHFAFWGMLFLLNAVSEGYLTHALQDNIICFGVRLPFLLAAVYFNLYILIPAYYYKAELSIYLVLIVVTVLVANTVNLIVFGLLMKEGLLPISLKLDAQFSALSFIGKEFFMVTVVGLTTGIKLSKDHFIQSQRAELVEKEQLATELSLLKSQLQPHFFFNTLNNLYALTIKKSDLAPEVVIKLSEFMSYVLYETDQEKTPLLKEISYIRSFIDLESLRFGNQPIVNFEISGKCESVSLPPLLLLPFIENSFKHSLKSGIVPVEIDISIEVSQRFLRLVVTNPCNETFMVHKRGIGLRNVKRRLDLIYEGDYQLIQKRLDHKFITELEVPLP